MRTFLHIIQNAAIVALLGMLTGGCSREPSAAAISRDQNESTQRPKQAAAPVAPKLTVMQPSEGDLVRVSEAIQKAAKAITIRESNEATSSDEAKKGLIKKVYVETFEREGFDLDATLKNFSTRMRSGDVTPDEASVAFAVIAVYEGQAADFARWGFISQETSDLISKPKQSNP